MEVLETIFTRRCICRFTAEPVTDKELDTVLRAGFQAPSAHNGQPWEFIIIKDKEKFERISKFHPYAKMVPQAQVCVIVCGNENRQKTTGFMIEDCSAAIENMLLAAHGMNLGAVWCGLYPVPKLTKEMKKLCSLPDFVIPVGMIVLGHKGEEKAPTDRYDAAKIHSEIW
jgi:nitroreductase